MTDRCYVDPASKPYPFCPGCSHATLFDRLDAALRGLDLDPRRVVVVSDIGCIGIGDRHFVTHTFHGLHGRAITYATGLKVADPGLTVIALVGDGGVGIGGHHFLNAARRNVGITVLVGNNFNFGMTGGQHSVTTPHGGRTATTPQGNLERPMDLCGLVAAAGGSFAARAMIFDKDLPDLLRAAITRRGFAAVEVWELCVAYYGKSNDLDRRALEDLLATTGLPRGVVVDRDAPELTDAQARQAGERGAARSQVAPAPIEERFSSPLRARRTLLVTGSAGQKVKSSSAALARAAVASGLWAVQRDDYPVTVMTGHSLAELAFDVRPIDRLGVDVPDDALLVSEDGRRVSEDKLARMAPSGRVYTLPELAGVRTPAQVRVVDPKPLRLPRTAYPLALAALYLRETGLLPVEALRRAVGEMLHGPAAEEAAATIDAVERLERT